MGEPRRRGAMDWTVDPRLFHLLFLRENTGPFFDGCVEISGRPCSSEGGESGLLLRHLAKI